VICLVFIFEKKKKKKINIKVSQEGKTPKLGVSFSLSVFDVEYILFQNSVYLCFPDSVYWQ